MTTYTFSPGELERLSNIPQEQVDDTENEESVTLTDIEKENSLVDLNLRREELEGKKQDRIQRKGYADKIFILLCLYLSAVMVLLYFNGFGLTNLEASVLIALVTTSAANVIGIFILVAKYLFHTKE